MRVRDFFTRRSKALFIPERWSLREDPKGFTLIEIMVTLAIFTIVMGGFFSAYLSQMKHTTREYKGAEAEIELGVAKNILLHDLDLAGYGLADDYSAASGFTVPVAAKGTDHGPDDLYLMGTSLSIANRASQEWTFMSSAGSPPTFHTWGDAREDLGDKDRVILMEPSTKKLLVQGTGTLNWLFRYSGSPPNVTTPPNLSATSATAFDKPSLGTLVYALYGDSSSAEAAQPYWAVHYYLSGDSPSGCATGTQSLLRAESDQTVDPDHGDPMLSCVLDMEVAFGVDLDENGTIDTWDNGGATYVNGYSADLLRKRLKEVKVYLLIQSSNYDRDYTFPLTSIRVGQGTNVGRDVDLNAEQRKYRWRLVTFSKTLRNLR